MLEDIRLHPFLRILKSQYPEKLEEAADLRHTICLPDPRNTRDIPLTEDFFSKHILSEEESGYFSSSDGSVTAEEKDCELHLLSCPGYQPSYHRGLYTSNILASVFQVNDKFSQYRMLVLDKPLVPKFYKMGNKQSSKKGGADRRAGSAGSYKTAKRDEVSVRAWSAGSGKRGERGKIEKNFGDKGKMDQTLEKAKIGRTLTRPCLVRQKSVELAEPPETDSTIVSSVMSWARRSRPSSSTRPTSSHRSASANSSLHPSSARLQSGSSIVSLSPRTPTTSLLSSRAPSTTPRTLLKSPIPPPRQVSADSGIEPDLDTPETLFLLPPQASAYQESEGFLLAQQGCQEFVSYLHHSLADLYTELVGLKEDKTVLTEAALFSMAARVKRLVQESLISFPKVTSTVRSDPAYQHRLKIAVENIVLQLLHPNLWPLVKRMQRSEDIRLHKLFSSLWSQGFSPRQLGLLPAWDNVPLPAALVELAALDSRSTPLDKLSCLHDATDQIQTHIRSAVVETNAGSMVTFPRQDDEVLLLAGLLVSSRPLYLSSTLLYTRHFCYSAPPDMTSSLDSLVRALDRLAGPHLTRQSQDRMGKEMSLQELIGLTDELQQRFDRQGNLVDLTKPRTTLDLHKEKFTARLELSSQDLTRQQEEAWRALDTGPSPVPPTTRWPGLLHLLHTKLLCSDSQI